MPDYGDDWLDDIAELQTGQTAAFGAGQKRAPLTRASAGWELPNRSTPPAPDSGGHIYAASDEPRWRGADGSDYSLVPPEVPDIPKASAVSALGTMAADGDIGSTPSAGNYNALRADVSANRVKINAILDALKDCGLMDS